MNPVDRYKPAPLISVDHNGKTYLISEDERWFFDQDSCSEDDAQLNEWYGTRTTVNGFVFNENGMCLNAAIGFNVDLKKYYNLRIELAQVSVNPELWSAGYSYSAGNSGGGSGVSMEWDDKFATPAEAEINQLQIQGKRCFYDTNNPKCVKMLKMIDEHIAALKREYNITEPKEIITHDQEGQYNLILE